MNVLRITKTENEMKNKNGGSTRFCVDYRQLNNVTKNNSHPPSRIACNASTLFSTLDLNSGFWQVEMDPEDPDFTLGTG